MDKGVERRRFGRIRLDMPLSGRLDEQRVKILDLSVTGFLVAHEGRLAPGQARVLALEWQGRKFVIGCEVVRSYLWRLARSPSQRSVHHTALRISGVSPESFELLRELIADRVVRALEEQKANARGIPPLAAYMYQPQKGELFRRCELVDGVWRKTETIRETQPENGFTISVDVEPEHVELLCRTWEATTDEGRRLTKLLAELSISRAEGIPTRRYVP